MVCSRHHHGHIVVGIVGYHEAEEIAVFYLMESRSIAEILFPAIDLEDLQIFDASTQHHVKQIARRREPDVDSECGEAIPMTLIAREGKFVVDGQSVRRI